MEACSAGNIAVIDVLLSRGADVNLQDNMGCTALMRVAYAGFDELVKLLVKNGADTKIVDKDGRTAKDYYAERNNNEEILSILK